MALMFSSQTELVDVRPARASRLLAAASYLLGSLALVIVAVGPRNPFLVRHAQQAMILHVVRLAIVSCALLIWFVGATDGEPTAPRFTLHLAMLILLGMPWPGSLESSVLLLLSLPLGLPWILAAGGAMIAASGWSLDFRSLLSRRFPDSMPDGPPEMGTPEYDRSIGLRNRVEVLGGWLLRKPLGQQTYAIRVGVNRLAQPLIGHVHKRQEPTAGT
jgi:hypothetical protein